MGGELYILRDRTPVRTRDVIAWGRWFEDISNRQVARTDVPGGYVSTVFLGVDHNFGSSGPPVLFETVAFINEEAAEQERTCTWPEAVAQHNYTVLRMRMRGKAYKPRRTPMAKPVQKQPIRSFIFED